MILRSLRSLVYYGKEEGEEHRLFEMFQVRGIIAVLEELNHKEGSIGESAGLVLDSIFYKGPS